MTPRCPILQTDLPSCFRFARLLWAAGALSVLGGTTAVFLFLGGNRGAATTNVEPPSAPPAVVLLPPVRDRSAVPPHDLPASVVGVQYQAPLARAKEASSAERVPEPIERAFAVLPPSDGHGLRNLADWPLLADPGVTHAYHVDPGATGGESETGGSRPPLASLNLSPPAGMAATLLKGHTDVVTGVVFVADGRQVLSSSLDSTLRLWNVADGRELRQFDGHTEGVHCLAVSADGRRVLSGGGRYAVQRENSIAVDCTMRLWDVETGQELRRFVGHTGPVTGVAFSPDGRHALSGSHDRTLRLWDLESGQQVQCCLGHTSGIHGVAFLPDGRHAVSAGGCEMTVRVWDLTTGREMMHLPGHLADVESVVADQDGRRVFSASGGQEILNGRARSLDCTIHRWDLGDGREVQRFEGHTRPVEALALSADERRLLSGSLDGTVRVWDVASGRQLTCFTGHSGGVWAVALSPDSQWAVSAGEDQLIRLWALAY